MKFSNTNYSFEKRKITHLPGPSHHLLTKSYIHSVLSRRHFDSTELSHTHITALVFLSHIADDDASLEVAVVTHTEGQRSSVTSLQSEEGDLRVGHKTGDGAVLTCSHQNDVHHGALEGILGV